MKVLVNYLIPYLNFEDYDANHLTNAQQTMYLDAFVAIFDSIRKDILQCICFINININTFDHTYMLQVYV